MAISQKAKLIGSVAMVLLGLAGGGAYALRHKILEPDHLVSPPAPEPSLVADAPAEPSVASDAQVTSGPSNEAELVPVTSPNPPKVTTWFVNEMGDATIAGEAAPAALVTLIFNDLEHAQVVATGGGEFALFTTFPPSSQPSVMKVQMQLPSGETITSDELIVIAPIKGARLAAQNDMEAEDAPSAALLPDAQAIAVEGTEIATGIAASNAQPLALSVSPEGVALLGGAVAVEAAELNLDLISYPSPELVHLQGKAPAQSHLRVYLDNGLAGEAVADETGGWSLDLREIKPALYQLRLDALDAKGVVLARLEMPFKRETPEALADLSAGGDADATAEATAAAQALESAEFEEVTGEAGAEAQAITPVDRLTRGSPADLTGGMGATGNEGSAAAATQLQGESVTITVQPGHSLWAIAREQFGDGVLYVQVYEANKDAIRNPDLIYPGQVFTLPKP